MTHTFVGFVTTVQEAALTAKVTITQPGERLSMHPSTRASA